MQTAVPLGDRQCVIGQREMIHADMDIPGAGQFIDRQTQQPQFQIRRGQVLREQLSLGLEHAGKMRVAVDRQAVWTGGDHRIQRSRESL